MIRVLCDEDLPHKLRMHLPEHDVVTVGYMDWGGLKNGELLKAAEEAGFDVLLTGDQSMPKEQNIAGRNLAIVTLSAIEWPIIKPHVGKIAAAIVTAKPGNGHPRGCGSIRPGPPSYRPASGMKVPPIS